MAKSSRFWIAFSILMSISIALAAINLNENLRSSLRDFLMPEHRVVLAKATGDLLGTGRSFVVLKVRTQDTLSVEVFENDPATGKTIFRARAILPERRDGLFNYKGNTTNLLLLDVDKDKTQEIVAPGFDENLIPRVHIYKFNDLNSSLDSINSDILKN